MVVDFSLLSLSKSVPRFMPWKGRIFGLSIYVVPKFPNQTHLYCLQILCTYSYVVWRRWKVRWWRSYRRRNDNIGDLKEPQIQLTINYFLLRGRFLTYRTRPQLRNGKKSNKIRVKNLRASIPGLSFIKTRQTIVNSEANYSLHAKRKSVPSFFTISHNNK